MQRLRYRTRISRMLGMLDYRISEEQNEARNEWIVAICKVSELRCEDDEYSGDATVTWRYCCGPSI